MKKILKNIVVRATMLALLPAILSVFALVSIFAILVGDVEMNRKYYSWR